MSTDADFFYGVTDSETVDVGTFGLHDSDDGTDQDNSLGWTDPDPDAGMLDECPDCGDSLVHDEGDPDHHIAAGVHCDTCGWSQAD